MQLTPQNHVVVIFGANGDLARRKLLPALYHLEAEGLMPEDYRIIGNSRSEMSTQHKNVPSFRYIRMSRRCG